MRASALERRQRADTPLQFSLAWTATVAFLLFVTRDPPDPALLVTVALAALPYATAPRHRLVARVGAAALLAAFVALWGVSLGSLLFLPAVGALLLSAYRLRGAEERPRTRRRRKV